MSSFTIGFVLFPDVTQLDLTGPLQILHQLPESKTHIVAKTLDPVPSDCGLSLLPTTTFRDCDPLDLICVPGGAGVSDAIADRETLRFICQQAERARYITAVCTGAFVLGVAGLLDGRQATTHWAYTDLLPMVGAIFAKGRVVRDGNVFTSGGVTAGIDFALRLASEIAGPDTAQAIQLALEYDPEPPFAFGHPDGASDAVRSLVMPRFAKRLEVFRAELQRAMAG